MTERGKFITFEGGEGCGKSTQARMVADILRNNGIDVVLTREPGGSPGAERIRRILIEGDVDAWDGNTELLLFNAARRDHIQKTIMPALEAGKWVISDRYVHSTVAYQLHGRGVASWKHIYDLHVAFCYNLLPDLCITLDVPVEVGHARIMKRMGQTGGLSRFEAADREFHERIKTGYIRMAKNNPHIKLISYNEEPAEMILEYILSAISQEFGLILS